MNHARPLSGRRLTVALLAALALVATTVPVASAADPPVPPAPPSVTATHHGEPLDNCWDLPRCSERVALGDKVTFTFTSTSPDAVSLRYRWIGTNPVTVDGAAATLELEPPNDGRLLLMVQSVNSFGQPSQDTNFMLFVGPAPGPVGSWEFNDGSGTTAADGPGLTHPLALAGSTFEASGRLDGGLALDGADDYASASESVVDTSQSFSISVWARPTNPSKLGVIASANGANTTATGLGYDPSSKRWVFARTSADVRNPTLYKASSKEAPVNGAWSHLLAMYDVLTGALKFYVNGRLQQETTSPATAVWKATGALTVGRGLLTGAAGGYFAGSIDNLQIWQRVLRPEEVLELQLPKDSNGMVVTGDVAHWPLDTAVRGADQVWRSPETVRGADLTVSGFQGADQSKAFVDDAERGKVLQLNGSSRASVSLGRPLVDASASFSLAVMVKLTDPTKPGVILRQGTATTDTWRLAYEPVGDSGQFTFARANAGSNTETAATLTVTADEEDLDGWHLITASYVLNDRDPSQDQISLTRDLRSRDGSLRSFTAPRRDGTTTVGKPGPTGAPFTGRLDNIHLYTGNLATTEVCTDYPGQRACGS
ncbi:LamG domain-containing protein [Kribbella sp. NPDC058245]|uniref:LamG domain-containing protein n=1 Tax=Kribbella sp. NPDC058245 TaxID=3346399 RepID=UPI0036EAAEE3